MLSSASGGFRVGEAVPSRLPLQARLGRDRIGVLAGDKDKSQIKQFLNSYVIYAQRIL